jgi:hypothetical protein
LINAHRTADVIDKDDGQSIAHAKCVHRPAVWEIQKVALWQRGAQQESSCTFKEVVRNLNV